MELTIKGTDKKRLKKVRDFAEKLGLNTSSKANTNDEILRKQKRAVEAMKKLAKIGSFKDIDDPVKWQREQRKDRDIGRDE